MSYDKTTGRTDIELFSSDDYDYDTYEVKTGSVLEQFLNIYDNDKVVKNAKEQIKHETYIMIHVFPMFMIAYGKLVKDEEQMQMFGGVLKYFTGRSEISPKEYVISDIKNTEDVHKKIDKWKEVIKKLIPVFNKNTYANILIKLLEYIQKIPLVSDDGSISLTDFVNPFVKEHPNTTNTHTLIFGFKTLIEDVIEHEVKPNDKNQLSVLNYIINDFPKLIPQRNTSVEEFKTKMDQPNFISYQNFVNNKFEKIKNLSELSTLKLKEQEKVYFSTQYSKDFLENPDAKYQKNEDKSQKEYIKARKFFQLSELIFFIDTYNENKLILEQPTSVDAHIPDIKAVDASKQEQEQEPSQSKIDGWIKSLEESQKESPNEKINVLIQFIKLLEQNSNFLKTKISQMYGGDNNNINIKKLIEDLKKSAENNGGLKNTLNEIDENLNYNGQNIIFNSVNNTISYQAPAPAPADATSRSTQLQAAASVTKKQAPTQVPQVTVKPSPTTNADHAKYMLLVLTTLAKIDELRAPGWLEAIRATIGSLINIFDEDSSMSNFIKAISQYDENKNKYRAKMYAEVTLLRNDDRLNGQPKCDDAPIDVDIHVDKSGPSAISKINSALNTITHGLEVRPEITTNPVGLEAGANPGSGYNLNVNSFGESGSRQKGSETKSTQQQTGMLNQGNTNTDLSNINNNNNAGDNNDNDDEMLGGSSTSKKPKSRRLHKLSSHNKKNKTRRIGLRAQFGFK